MRGMEFELDHLLNPAAVFDHPRDVLNDADLSRQEKRAILSSWASDACAVDSMPGLRQQPGGRAPSASTISSTPCANLTASPSLRDPAERRCGLNAVGMATKRGRAGPLFAETTAAPSHEKPESKVENDGSAYSLDQCPPRQLATLPQFVSATGASSTRQRMMHLCVSDDDGTEAQPSS